MIRPHHHQIADALTRLTLGLLLKPNLMILMPPRCCKTSLGSEAYVPWAMSAFPDSEFILSSYSSDLSTSSTVKIRDTLASDWYRSIVGSDWGATVEMRGERAGGRQDYFHSREGGSVKAIGMSGGITGFGAGKLRPEFGGAIIIDDPLKQQDARSPTMRASAIDYIKGTLKSRRNRKSAPVTPIILIMQRLHPEDPAGILLREERDEWNVLQIQARQSDGTSIWEERIGTAELEQMQLADPQTYWSQYQQEPSQTALNIFKYDWWQYWNNRNAVEGRLTLKVITADTAFKAKDSADFSVFQCWGWENQQGAYLLDQDRGQWDFPDLLSHARAFLDKHTQGLPSNWCPVTEFWIEDRASGTSLVQTMRREGLRVREWLPDDKTAPDKVARAKQASIPISAGRVFVPDPKMLGYRWVDSFINEHSAFTVDDSHLHDDAVDAETMAILLWMQRGGGRGAVPQWTSP